MTFLLKHMDFKKGWFLVALIIVLIPSFFIHSQKYPDWGDDFAQYIYQSQQIHTPSTTYNQVLNINEYSSSKRSVFFSLVLSIISPTIEIQQYVDVISVLYTLSAVCFFLFLTTQYSSLISFTVTLSVFYNFLLLRLKSEVVPEFLYIALFFLILFLLFKYKKQSVYVIPVLLGLLVSVRFVGLSLVGAYLFMLIFEKEETIKIKATKVLLSVLVFGITVWILNGLILNKVVNHEVGLYGGIVSSGLSTQSVIENISLYVRYLTLFFEQEIPYWMNYIVTFFAFTFFIIGFVYSIIKKRDVVFFSFIFYFLFLFIYPYNADTIKYLIPIVPLLFYYIISGITIVINKIQFMYNQLVIVSFFAFVFLSNSKTVWLAIKNTHTSVGPYEASILKDFEYIKTLVKPNQNIAFGKPFIINLLANRDAYFLSTKNAPEILTNADFVLLPKSSINELYPNSKDITVQKADTVELTHFYLIKL